MIQTISCIVPVQKKTHYTSSAKVQILTRRRRRRCYLMVLLLHFVSRCAQLCVITFDCVKSERTKKKRLWVIVVSPSGEARSCRDGREIELDLPWEINACGTTREKEKKTSNS